MFYLTPSYVFHEEGIVPCLNHGPIKRLWLDGKFATNTLWLTTHSLINNIASQVYSHKCGFNATYHMTQNGTRLANLLQGSQVTMVSPII